MGPFPWHDQGLTPGQIRSFKLSVSAACRKMTADQILDVADQLHDIIRKRAAGCRADDLAIYDPAGDDAAP